MALSALIFDCDGTLAETEEAHRNAFNQAFADAGLNWQWSMDRYGELLKVTGGRERIAHFIAEERLPDVDIAVLHSTKNTHYARLVETGQVRLRPGVMDLINQAQASGIAIAIATTTSRSNLDSLIDATALRWIDFAVIVCGEDVAKKKPDPEAYHLALQRLSLPADECLAFEDSENGVSAAFAAGIETVAIPSSYTKNEDFRQALLRLQDLENFPVLSRISRISDLRRLQSKNVDAIGN